MQIVFVSLFFFFLFFNTEHLPKSEKATTSANLVLFGLQTGATFDVAPLSNSGTRKVALAFLFIALFVKCSLLSKKNTNIIKDIAKHVQKGRENLSGLTITVPAA